jgi:hypothetical protein
MFQMLVLANGQSNLLRVPGGAGFGVMLGLGVAVDPDVAAGLLPGVPVAPGDAVPGPPGRADRVSDPRDSGVAAFEPPGNALAVGLFKEPWSEPGATAGSPPGTPDVACPQAASASMTPAAHARTCPFLALEKRER